MTLLKPRVGKVIFAQTTRGLSVIIPKIKEKALTKWTFDFDQKVKIFKRGLSHSVFRIHSDFGIRFFVRELEIEKIVQFPKI